ncbi:aspartic proteinase CDR1-like [Neltuma alba]|uniref:aspartic proteinase CDR1-like n=1 Tax=Neltuma alba TaxID=207710 RepID=UPI0010A2DDD8|nr:aspartic proteinase CDR1-like [Prosopis alba]
MTSSVLLVIVRLCLVFLSTAFAFPPLPPLNTAASTTVTTKPRRIATRLPHWHAHATNSNHHSPARVSYLVAKANGASDDIRSPVIAESSGMQFMVNISFGKPPVPQLLTMDTGSNLLWIQCLPCVKCFQQKSPLFDPLKSSTYTNLPCYSPFCYIPSKDKCDPYNTCKFSETYKDGTAVSGLLGTDDLTLETSDEGTTTVRQALMGCAHNNDGYNGEPSGILGLGPSRLSLVTKLGSKFSYCLGSIRDPKYPHSVLILGEEAAMEGDTTPLEIFNDLYYVTLESISFGDKKLNIDPNSFKRTPEGKGGVVIDSGTTISYLVVEGYRPIIKEVKNLLDWKLKPVVEFGNPSICYEGVIERDLIGFPVVTLRFAGGAELALDVNSFFHENGKEEFCVAMEESHEDLSIIGAMAQQNYNVGFDINARKLALQRIDCQLLDLRR